MALKRPSPTAHPSETTNRWCAVATNRELTLMYAVALASDGDWPTYRVLDRGDELNPASALILLGAVMEDLKCQLREREKKA